MPQLSTSTLIDPISRNAAAAVLPDELAFEQTVRRSLVHKRLFENVLLTDLRACGDDRFLCAGRLPIAHRFFNQPGRSPRQDILYYTELGRQASLAISHAFLDVDQNDVFIFEGSHASLTDAAWQTPQRANAIEPVFVEIRIAEIARRRNNAVNRVVAEHIMRIGDDEVFRGTGAWTVQPAALFQRLRRMANGGAAPVPSNVTPFPAVASTRGASAEHAVITPERATGTGELVSRLIVDETHPYFFDHPCDHVPGMLLLEGCAQLAMAASLATASGTPLGIRSYHVNFSQFVECGIPTVLTARVDGDTVDLTIAQRDTVAGTTKMDVAFAR
jgi:hypothetical protein